MTLPDKARLTRILRPWVGALARWLFRAKVTGLAHYEAAMLKARAEGRGVLIICNHVSYLDGFLLYLLLPDPIAFAINTDAAEQPRFRLVLWFPELYVLDSFNPHASKQIIGALKRGETIGIFPEGRLSDSGGPMKVYEGTAMIAERAGALILPVGIDGTQHSRMTRLKGLVRQRTFPRIRISILPAVSLPGRDALDSGSRRRQSDTRCIEQMMREIQLHNALCVDTLPAAVIAAAERHGANRAIFEDLDRQPLTYRALLMKSFILAELLAPHTRTGERVGVFLPNACGTVVTVLALCQRGRVPAMLNIGAGARVLSEACTTGSLRLVLTSRRFVAAAGLEATIETLASQLTVLYLDDLRRELTTRIKTRGLLAALLPRRIREHPEMPRDPETEAVLLFTSGSESTPKGVLLTHRNLLANVAQTSPLLHLSRQDLIFASLPVFHTFGLTCGVILPLLDGARSFLYPSPLHYRPIPEYCYVLGATVLFGTNTFLLAYARSAHPFDFQRMRMVVAGAEPLREQTRALWMEKFGVRIMEGYGLTETSPVLAVNTPLAYRRGSVGQPVAGVSLSLLPVDGIAEGGRLQVRGPNIMRGYLLHDAPTEIVPPNSPLGDGWFDTGDIARLDEDGFIYIIGRAKRFAKIGGEMISLARVEALAFEISAEYRHAALACPDPRKGEQVVLLTEAPALERAQLLAEVQRQGISELLIPRHVHRVDEIPVLRSGKTDYQALKQLFETVQEAQTT